MKKIRKVTVHGFRCKDDGYIFKCENNKTGEISKYIKKLGYNDCYRNHIEPYDVEVDMLFCPYCDYKTKDLLNKSGTFTNHMKKVHNKTPKEVLDEYPEYSDVFAYQKDIYDTQQLNNEVGIKCLICGKKFRKLTPKHLELHGLTPSEYKNKFNLTTTCSNHTTEILHNNSLSGQFEQILARVNRAGYIPLFTFDEYKGVKGYTYKFKCKDCGHEFVSSIDYGRDPKCPICKKYKRNY